MVSSNDNSFLIGGSSTSSSSFSSLTLVS